MRKRYVLTILVVISMFMISCENGVTPDTTPLNPYNINFDKNDISATGSMDPQSIGSGTTVRLNPNLFKKPGIPFCGWSLTPTGPVVYPNGANFTMDSSDHTLYAQWNTWTRLLCPSTPSLFVVTGLAVDAYGNSFVTGQTYTDVDGEVCTGMRDVYVTKYNSAGGKEWTRLSGVSAGDNTVGFDIATDAMGNCYVTGNTQGNLDGEINNANTSAFVIKYDPAGSKLWTRIISTVTDDTLGRRIAVDLAGNSYTCGYITDYPSGSSSLVRYQAFITKYDCDGTFQWTQRTGSAGNSALGDSVAVDAYSNVYFIGRSKGNYDGQTALGITDTFVTKYDFAGVKQWTRLLGLSGIEVIAHDVSVDTSGNVYVAGGTNGSLDGVTSTGFNYYAFVTKYLSSGEKQWTKMLGASGTSIMAESITADSNGNAYITGSTTVALGGKAINGTKDAFLATYDTNGSPRQIELIGISGIKTEGVDVDLDLQGNAFVSGNTRGNLDGETNPVNVAVFVTSRMNR